MDALIVVDVQNDFLPGGALAVPDGDAVISVINNLAEKFELIAATQDWHPANHGSFVSWHPEHRIGDIVDLNGLPQVVWPDHCVQGTYGAEFATALHASARANVFPKGTDATVDSYSGFFDNGRRQATALGGFLKNRNVRRVFVTGLATDYCVRFTALDAISLGFEVVVVEDACRGVNLHPHDVKNALKELQGVGIQMTDSGSVLRQNDSERFASN